MQKFCSGLRVLVWAEHPSHGDADHGSAVEVSSCLSQVEEPGEAQGDKLVIESLEGHRGKTGLRNSLLK